MVFIKLTAIGCQTPVATQSFAESRTLLINPYKIMTVMANNKGITELRDELGKNIILVKETPEEIYDLINKECTK